MRKSRTLAEEFAISNLSGFLTKLGHKVKTKDEITDNPDWVFSLDNKTIAAECTYLTVEKFMQWNNQEFPIDGKTHEIVIPVEPHIWMEKIIRSKAKKIQQYKANADASEVWLILHTDPIDLCLLETQNEEQERSLIYPLAMTATILRDQHSFSRIWLVRKQGITEIWTVKNLNKFIGKHQVGTIWCANALVKWDSQRGVILTETASIIELPNLDNNFTYQPFT